MTDPSPSTSELWIDLRRLLRSAVAEWSSVVPALAGLAAIGAAQLSLTWSVKQWVEDLLGDHPIADPLVWQLIAAALVALLVAGIFISRYSLRRFEQGILLRLRDLAASRLLEVPARGIRSEATGDLLSRILHDADRVACLPPFMVRRVTDGILVAGGALVLMLVLDLELALFAGAALIPVALLFDRFQKAIRRSSVTAHQAIGSLGALLNEQLAGATTIRLFGSGEFERRRFADSNRRAVQQMLITELWSTALVTSVWLLAASGMLAAIWYGGQQVQAGTISTGGLLAFCLYGAQLVEPVRRLGDLQAEVQRAAGPLRRLFTLCDLPSEHSGSSRLATSGPATVRFEGVFFAYRKDRPVLRSIDLEIGPGESVALVAASGGGKSTLASLLVRLIDADRGEIRIDDHALGSIELASLRKSVVLVEQESFLFNASLRQNLLYGTWDATEHELNEAIWRVGLEPWIDSLPQGLATPVAEAGRSLSGGQRQRIALARAILRAPRLLILDEASSALDSESEGLIFERLENWLQQRTVLVLAHRLSTVNRLPRVVTLVDGQIVADGPPRDLLRDCRAFRDLFRDQAEVLAPSPGTNSKLGQSDSPSG